MESLEDLPTFKEAIKLSKDEYYRYAKGVYEYHSYCLTDFAESYEKFYEWCAAFDCTKARPRCIILPYPEFTSTLISTITTGKTILTTSSYSQLMRVVGYNGTCYDEYYCNQRSAAIYLHFIIGILCLIMCLIGILSTSLFLPAFNVISNRSGITLYLTVVGVIDCIYMILFTIIVVIQYVPREFTDQLDMYSRFTAYLIPHGLPSMQLMELLSVWLTVAILVDRFLYLKFGFHSKIICSRKVSAKTTAAIVILLLIYTIPKYLEYKFIEFPEKGIMRVMYTTVGFNTSFQNLLLHWLKVPIEMFLPYLADAIFSVINSIKFYDLMYKRKLSESASKNKKKMTELNMNNNNECDVNTIMLSDLEKETFKFPSITVNSSIPIITSSLKDAEDKENEMVIVSLIIGFLLIALKIPKFVLHALKSEEYVDASATKFFQPANDFLDLTWVLMKPLIYLCTAKHFRKALKSIFCCTKFESDGIIKVCPVVPIAEVSNDYLLNNTNFSNNNKFSLSEFRKEDELMTKKDEDLDV